MSARAGGGPGTAPGPAEVAVSTRGLIKDFGTVRALDGLDLTIPSGEVHGFLGPNGAGKTTTLRILLGLLRTSSGQVYLLGGDPWRDAARLHRRLAYVPGETVTLLPRATGAGRRPGSGPARDPGAAARRARRRGRRSGASSRPASTGLMRRP